VQPKIELTRGQTIVFTGDSITDAHRDHPAYRPFGYGYVNFVANLLLAKYPELDLRIINTGISGDTVRDLESRWERDCIAHRPDVLSVLIGINDIWGCYAEPGMLATAVYSDEYESTCRQLLSRAKEQCNCQLVLMEPFMFCDDPTNEMFKALGEYIRIIRNLARKRDAVLVPLQSEIDEQIKDTAPEKWSSDSVHPYVWAHAWIAQHWLQATGL
jgi:lysophospholipase L1-like esterase